MSRSQFVPIGNYLFLPSVKGVLEKKEDANMYRLDMGSPQYPSNQVYHTFSGLSSTDQHIASC
jgi:hypothetical protein